LHTDSLLLIIDVQVGLVAGQNPLDHTDELFAQINSLITRVRATGTSIIYVQDVDVAPLDSPDFAIHFAVAPSQGDLIIHKRAVDAFYKTPLQHELESRGIKHLVVAGCKTEYCIDTTCRIATNLGYDVTLAGDAHATTDNGVLSATQIIAHHNRVMDGFGVDGHYVVTKNTADVEFPVIWTGHHFD
jgi:nicotinamidase-related amidase